jgi:hypothetical protein
MMKERGTGENIRYQKVDGKERNELDVEGSMTSSLLHNRTVYEQ